MFGNVGRRLLEGTVGLFAVLGFLYVPLGRQTGFEHARAVFTTPAATAAIEDITRAVFDLRSRALDWMSERAESALALPAEPFREAVRAHGTRPEANGPKPVLPKLKATERK